ncbi:MAG: hypothetical protein MJK04_07715, partial [Psychrosphaera sp.]|nr:hypothetical protein [Psychrosphaera sp.]
RGADISVRTRLSQIKPQIGRMGLTIGTVCLVGFVSTGSYIFYQTNVVANYFTSEEVELWRVDYEKQFKRFLSVPQPQIQRVKTEVALYPKQRRYEVTGQYSLINRQNVDVHEFLVSLDKDIDVLELTVPASELETYAEFGVHHVKLKQPLAPGKSLQLTFKLQQQQSGFGQFSSSELVTDNATMLYAGNRFPVIGYIEQMELGNEKRREVHGLPAQALPQVLEQSLKSKLETTRPFVEFESIVSTTADQTAIANGTLQRQWIEGERAYFHYKTDAPIRNEQVYLSAEYSIAKRSAQGVDIAVYYHPAHGVNVPRMLNAIEDSLAYQVSQFGPYPHKQFKQVETAAYTRFTGLAVPGMTLISEHAGFTYDLRNSEALDQVYRRGAHEVAHQWWAHKLAPAKVDEGAGILTETLARYNESMIMKKVYGEQVALNFIEYEMGRYFRGRARERDEELPLYRARSNQQYLLYSKGAVAMYALQHQIGEARINRALKQLVEKYAYPNTPPTTLDLIALLYQEAPEHKGLIDRWFKDMITVDNRLTSAEYKVLDDGRFEVELAIEFSEFRAASTGEDVLIDDLSGKGQALEVEVMFEGGGRVVQLVEIKSGINKIRLVVAQLPVSVKLDPNRLMLNKVWLSGEGVVVKG